MKKMFFYAVLCTIALSAGCIHVPEQQRPFRDHGKDYLRYSASIPPLKAPPGVQLNTGKSFYPIPPLAGQSGPLKPVSLVPPQQHLIGDNNHAA